MKRAALYVRVSTQEQKKYGLSVDSQIDALRKYCKENDLIEVGLYNDAGISARKKYTKRPALLSLLNDCRRGKIDTILFTKLDRWFRSVGDYYEVQNVLDEHHVAWKTIWEDYETETSSGQFKVNIMLAVAQSEADRTSERIKAVNNFRRDQGYYVGTAPHGYRLIKNGLEFDPDTYDQTKALFDTYLATFSTSKAMEAAAEKGWLLNRTRVPKLLKLPAYYGEATGGYKCPAYITKEEHDLIMSRSSGRRPNSGRCYLFSGLIKCGICGNRLTAHYTIRKWGLKSGNICSVGYNKYDCVMGTGTRYRHESMQITEKPLEKTLLAVLDEKLKDYRAEVKLKNEQLCLEDSYKKKEKLESRLMRVARLFEMGDLPEDEYVKRRNAIRFELDQIRIEPIPNPPELPDNWKEVYESLDQEHKKAFWLRIIKSITVSNENKGNPEIEFL